MAKRLLIRGRVQGVGFRESMCWEADRLGVAGWVRNRRDGSVEAVVEGPPDAMARMLEWCRTGPSGALVTSLDVGETEGGFAEFERWPTA